MSSRVIYHKLCGFCGFFPDRTEIIHISTGQEKLQTVPYPLHNGKLARSTESPPKEQAGTGSKNTQVSLAQGQLLSNFSPACSNLWLAASGPSLSLCPAETIQGSL